LNLLVFTGGGESTDVTHLIGLLRNSGDGRKRDQATE
jgi:hypothetical protein